MARSADCASPDADGFGEREQRVLEHRDLEPIKNGTPMAIRVDQLCLLQHREMRRHGRLGDVELVGQLARGHRPGTQQLQHAAPGGIGECSKDPIHIFIISQLSKCCQEVAKMRPHHLPHSTQATSDATARPCSASFQGAVDVLSNRRPGRAEQRGPGKGRLRLARKPRDGFTQQLGLAGTALPGEPGQRPLELG